MIFEACILVSAGKISVFSTWPAALRIMMRALI
jgi:hypothetical protein